MRRIRSWKQLLAVLLVALVVWVGRKLTDKTEEKGLPEHPQTTERIDASAADEAFRNKQSRVWMTVQGEVVYLMHDDTNPENGRHQQFLIELPRPSELTLKVAHNIDIAERVPISKGDRVVVRGRYEWNEKGGVVHWTHRDERGRRAGGWIEFQGKRYR